VGIDLASSASERSDYTSCVEVIEDSDHNLYVIGAWKARLPEGHKDWLTGVNKEGALVQESGPRLLWPEYLLPHAGNVSDSARNFESVNIEAVQHQSTFVREILGTTNLPARPVRPDKDKVTRSRALAARYEAGKVFHVKNAPGIRELEAEMAAFPNGEHDDLVDALVYAADLSGTNFYFTGAKTGSRF
jgi:predicted phage terminase large subunit-like protein